eukprot:3197483-Amphidinium_carterae.1
MTVSALSEVNFQEMIPTRKSPIRLHATVTAHQGSGEDQKFLKMLNKLRHAPLALLKNDQ